MDKETETTINRFGGDLLADKKMVVDLADYLIKENVKLREALEKIALSVCEIKTDSAGAWSYCITIAKTALKEGE